MTGPRQEEDTLLGMAAEEYCALLQAGSATSVDDFVARFDGVEDDLRAILPVLERLEHVSARVREQHDDRAGTRLGDYLLRRRIGQGGMGVVYEALQLRLDRRVAVKLLSLSPRRQGELRERFRVEALVAASLQHPNIVPVIEVGEAGDESFIVMQYIDGSGLDQVTHALRRSSEGREEHHDKAEKPDEHPASLLLGESDLVSPTLGRGDPAEPRAGREGGDTTRFARNVAALGLQAARALVHAHGRGVLHRDVKPSNLILDRSGRVWLTDFGLCKTEELDLTQSGDVLGTLRYLAPERLEGDGDVRSDVYGLGLTLYQLLTRRVPFEGKDRAQLLRSVLDDTPEPIRGLAPSVPGDLLHVVEHATSRDPEQRYRTAQAMAEDLQAFLERRPISPRGTSLRYVARLAYERHRAWFLSLAVAGLILVASTAAFLVRLDGARRESLEHLGLAERRLDDYRRLEDGDRLHELIAQARGTTTDGELGPIAPGSAPRFAEWLEAAESLAARLPEHRRAIEVLETELASGQTGRVADSPPGRLRWQADAVDSLCRQLERFADPDPTVGDIASVQLRLRMIQPIVEQTLEQARPAWQAAMESIADREECPEYGGLRITPQLGLVPIGRNPSSGLWEFVHLLSGAHPARDEGGEIVPTAEMGVVLVLLPGGTFTMGADNLRSGWSTGSRNLDPWAKHEEGPPREVELDPFFMSRHEMTRAQWRRISGLCSGTTMPGNRETTTNPEACPVDQVTFEESVRHLARVDLVLPTEAQWEYAARAGTHTVWWTGDDPASLQGAANLHDISGTGDQTRWSVHHEWDDGYPGYAPVGSFRANPFGLFDVHGNVRELCGDRHVGYELVARIGDGVRSLDPAHRVATRGGTYHEHGFTARCSRRYGLGTTGFGGLGLRPARRLDGVENSR